MQRSAWSSFPMFVSAAVCLAASSLLLLSAAAQNPAAQSNATNAAPSNMAADPLAQLTPEQHDKYNAGMQCLSAEKYADALAAFRQILPQLAPGSPGQVRIAELAAESAINTGERNDALDTLKPIAAANPNDWQAAAMLARIYAETGQKQTRDAALAHLVDLHTRAVSPQIGKMQQVLLERITLANGSMRIWYSLEPWGRYETYLFSRVYDQAGQQIFRITLESADFDQPSFVKEHPDLAAQGKRRFSLDGYGPDQKLPDGGTTQSHSMFGFYDGQPDYDTIRERMIQIAEGQAKPMLQTKPATQ